MCSALAFASSPTDDGPAAGVVSRAARSTASRSQESHPPSSAGPVSAGHPADHASVYESRLPESSPDDPPGTRSLTLPEVPKTTAWLRWLRCPPPPDLLKQRKTLALDSLHGSSVFSVNSPVSVSTIAMVCCFACRSHPTIFISASSVPSLWVRHHKVYSGRREADVVMSSVIRFAPAQDDESWPTCVSMRWLSERSFHEAHQLFGWGHIGSVRGAGLAG